MAVSSVIDYFKQKKEDKDAIRKIHHGILGETDSRPLVEMYGNLVKAHAETELYLLLLANTSGQYKDILVRNQSNFFFNRILGYITLFKNNLDQIEHSLPAIMEAIKGHTGVSTSIYYNVLLNEMNRIDQIVQQGGQLNALDVTGYLQALQNFTRSYITGVGETLGDLPHTLPDR
jgi:hypothetical protein